MATTEKHMSNTIPDIVIGEIATVVMKHRSPKDPTLFDVPTTVTYTGRVQPREAYDPPDSICMTGAPEHPQRLLLFRNIISWNGQPFKYEPTIIQPKTKGKGKAKSVPDVQYVEVDGSKPGTKYTLTIRSDGASSCSCPGFGFHHKCKHLTAYIEKQKSK